MGVCCYTYAGGTWWQSYAAPMSTVYSSFKKYTKEDHFFSAEPSRTSISSTWFHIHRLSSIQPRRALPSAFVRTASARLRISVASDMCTCCLFIVHMPLTHFLLVSLYCVREAWSSDWLRSSTHGDARQEQLVVRRPASFHAIAQMSSCPRSPLFFRAPSPLRSKAAYWLVLESLLFSPFGRLGTVY